MNPDERRRLEAELRKLREDLEDRKKALPAHSIRPHQLIAVEELEERIAELERQLETSNAGD